MGQPNITELVKQDDAAGSGNEAVSGRQVTVHYTGWLYDQARGDHKGQKFDSSRDRNEPFRFDLCRASHPGLGLGVAGMKSRQTTMRSRRKWATAARRRGVIPPNATLLFEVELLDVR